MSERFTTSKRVICVSEANIRQSHLYLSGLADLFPRDSLGPASSRQGTGRLLRLDVEGISGPVLTDIPTDAKTGKSRGFFRRRSWVREFFRLHGVRPGDHIAIERKGDHHYSIRREIPQREITVAEFFAGIGLVRLALERRGFRVVFANDIDPDKAEMYRHNWPNDDHLVVGDIHKLSPSEVPTCDLFTASFPCNDLSIAGRWEGLNGRESSAFWGLIKLIREMGERRPRLVLIENVLGFLMRHGGRDFERALLALNDLGYVVDAFILNAIHWAPQSRARLFVVATNDDGRDRHPYAMECDARPDSLCVFINTHPHIRWDIRRLPSLPRSQNHLVDVLEDLPDDDGRWWNDERADYFMMQLSPRHSVAAQRMIRGKTYTYATAFRRVRNGRSMAELRCDGIAGCLRTPRGGSGRQILFKAGRRKRWVRLLTPRECARLQGVPDAYVIHVPLNQALFGFGDAVCVPAIEWIAEHILNPATQYVGCVSEISPSPLSPCSADLFSTASTLSVSPAAVKTGT